MIKKLFWIICAIPTGLVSCPSCPEQFSTKSPPFFLQHFPEDQLFSVADSTPTENPNQFTTEDDV